MYICRLEGARERARERESERARDMTIFLFGERGREGILHGALAPAPKSHRRLIQRRSLRASLAPEGLGTQDLRFLAPKTFYGMAFGTRNLTCWVLGPSGWCILDQTCLLGKVKSLLAMTYATPHYLMCCCEFSCTLKEPRLRKFKLPNKARSGVSGSLKLSCSGSLHKPQDWPPQSAQYCVRC